LEILIKQLIIAAVAVAKDVLQKAILRKNSELLENKQKRAERENVSPKSIAAIVLSDDEKLNAELEVAPNESYEELHQHCLFVTEWAASISFRDIAEAKSLSSVYIKLDAYLLPVNSHFEIKERENKVRLEDEVLNGDQHCVILGQPGAGKTTSMKHLCSLVLETGSAVEKKYNFPILIQLRHLYGGDQQLDKDTDRSNILLQKLCQLVSASFSINRGGKLTSLGSHDDVTWSTLLTFFDTLAPLIVIDGFDEIPIPSDRDLAISEIRKLMQLRKAKVVLTSRTGDFWYEINNSRTFEIAPLSGSQVHQFTKKWLGARRGEEIRHQLEISPYNDSTLKPLTLAHLCSIYERIGKIPDKPKSIYRKIVFLLLEEWDSQRSIRRTSSYAKFELDRKLEFLSNLAFHLTVKFRSTVFELEHLEAAYNAIHLDYGLDKSESIAVANELESHTGLFIQAGYRKYEFSHKSIQEFLTAEYIVKLPTIPKKQEELALLANELAIAVSISSIPSIYYIELVINRLSRAKLQPEFWSVFITRLIMENPDFSAHEDLQLAIAITLTSWVCEGKLTGRAVTPNRINPKLVGEFNELWSHVDRVVLDSAMSRYYVLAGAERVSVGKYNFLKVQRKQQHSEYRLPRFCLYLDKMAAGA